MPISNSNVIDDQKNYQPVLSNALLFYRSDRTQISYATLHGVTNNGSGNQLSAAVPISKAEVRKLLEGLENESSSNNNKGLIPVNVLSFSNEHIAFYVLGKKRTLWFRQQGKNIAVEAPYPNLIFLATSKNLSVVAFKGKCRPTDKTRLYHAPLWNIYNDARVCTGSSELPTDYSFGSLEKWQDIIFNTCYSHVNHENTLKNKSNNNIEFWREMADRKTFDGKCLNPFKAKNNNIETVGSWLHSALKYQ